MARRQCSWLDTERFDITAKVPPGFTIEEFQKMLQNLLVERFKLALHHETRTLPIFELVIAKNSLKMRESVEMAEAGPSVGDPPAKDADGFPVLPAGRPGFMSFFGSAETPGLSHWTARQQTMEALVRRLSLQPAAGRQVIDKTGLTGKYDFKLVYEMRLSGVPATDDTSAPLLEDALEQQLGLKLVNSKAPFDFVIIDRGERVPPEN